jgi:hypothetical protein
VWRRVLFPGFNTVILHHGARSGPWRPGFPVDGDQHFQSMTTTCSG